MSQQQGYFLRVGEALPRDVGRTIARLDPTDMQQLGLQTGDVILIEGSGNSAARVMPAPAETRGQGLILVDGVTRANASATLGEKVRVSKSDCRPGKRLVLEALGQTANLQKDDYLAGLFEGLVVLQGDKVRLNLFGPRGLELQVISTEPSGVIQVCRTTEIKFVSSKKDFSETRVAYEDIGGLAGPLQHIREMIELPLKYPEVFERLGIEPPKGVLLTGPPGTGKTLIARAVAKETRANFMHVNGPEIIHKYYGESEANLREIFESAARKAPSIVFLDEIDAIAPKRAEVHGEVEKRVVAQLLALMDGIKSRGQVVVIGATNIPNTLDPALRRPGRFDREITIGMPDPRGRQEILQIHTRGMPLAENVDLTKLAQISHGYVGADLEALCKEGAMNCLRRVFPDFGAEPLSIEVMRQMKVQMEDFMAAFREIEPAITREVYVEVPDITWEQIGGLTYIKERLAEVIEWPLQYPQLFAKAGVSSAKGVLFYGEPGTGKTLVAKAVASRSGANFISVKGPQLLSKWVGESEKGVREIFKRARQAAPCVIFFDELESLVPRRGRSAAENAGERVLSQMLCEMDGIEDLHGVVVLAATNRIDMVDPALLRPGRFDLHLEFLPPDETERAEILRIHCQNKPLAADVNFTGLAEQTVGFSGAEIANLVRKASLLAVREVVHNHELSRAQLSIAARHFTAAFRELAVERGETHA